MILGIIGTTLTLGIPIIGIAIEQNIYKYYGYFVIALPFIIFAWIYGIVKSNKSPETKYGIRFWRAIKNAPRWMNVVLIFLIPFVGITSLIKPEIGLIGVLPLFDYMALLIYISAYLEK
jgi:hypothetical protein